MIGSAFIGFFFFFFPQQMLAIFGMTDPNVAQIGTQLLRVLAFSGIFISVALTYTGGLQGTGDTKGPLYISIISQVIVPLSICFVMKQLGTLEPIHIWLAILAGHVTLRPQHSSVQSGEMANYRRQHRADGRLVFNQIRHRLLQDRIFVAVSTS
jgi:hypothetical protein